jgi:AcrR family transcriptional regulator
MVTPPRERRNRHDEIIEAATHVFWLRGYSAASVQEIADEVGLLKGSLYHYIGSKEELLAQVFQEAYEESEAIMDSVRGLEQPPIEKLRTYLVRYIVQFLKNPERTQLYFRDWRYLTGEPLEHVVQQRHSYVNFVRDLVRAAQVSGDAPGEVSASYLALFILAAVHNVAEWYRSDGADSVERIAELHADLAVATIRGYIRGA